MFCRHALDRQAPLGKVWIAAACLRGEVIDVGAAIIVKNGANGSVREEARQNHPHAMANPGRARRLHNQCAMVQTGARNFVNDRQGYRTVKTIRARSSIRVSRPRSIKRLRLARFIPDW
jgi:hypothetical protein